MKAPQNPLAVIALLIGVVEAAFAYPVTQLQGTNQTVFVIFMVGFPVLLMLAFFLTVWFRPGHLYAPKDYTRDESFLEGIGRVPAVPSRKAIPQPVEQPIEQQLAPESIRGADAVRQPRREED